MFFCIYIYFIYIWFMFQSSMYTAHWYILLWFRKTCNLDSNVKPILDSFNAFLLESKNSQKVNCMFEYTHMQNQTAAANDDLQIRTLDKILWIISSFHAYKLFYSADSIDNEQEYLQCSRFFPRLPLYRTKREKAENVAVAFRDRNQDMLLCSLNLVSSLCIRGTSRSICKTAFINASHVIGKQEHTFGIPARWILVNSEKDRQRILLNSVVLNVYPVLWFCDKYIQSTSAVKTQILFFLCSNHQLNITSLERFMKNIFKKNLC